MFHRPRLLFAVHAGLFLGTVVACYLAYRSQAPTSTQVAAEPDYMVRTHLGLRSLRALYRIPVDKDHLVVTTFEVEDGGRPRPMFTAHWSRDDLGGSDVRLELIWGKVDGRMMVTVNWTGFGRQPDDFWENISDLTIHGRDLKKPVWQGYEVVAYGQSKSMIEPRRPFANESDEIARVIGRHRFVAILAVKPCATESEARAEAYRLNGLNP